MQPNNESPPSKDHEAKQQQPEIVIPEEKKIIQVLPPEEKKAEVENASKTDSALPPSEVLQTNEALQKKWERSKESYLKLAEWNIDFLPKLVALKEVLLLLGKKVFHKAEIASKQNATVLLYMCDQLKANAQFHKLNADSCEKFKTMNDIFQQKDKHMEGLLEIIHANDKALAAKLLSYTEYLSTILNVLFLWCPRHNVDGSWIVFRSIVCVFDFPPSQLNFSQAASAMYAPIYQVISGND